EVEIFLQRERIALVWRYDDLRADEGRRLLEPAPRRRKAPAVADRIRLELTRNRLVIAIDHLDPRQQQLGAVPVRIAHIGVVGVAVTVTTRPVLDALGKADAAGAIEPADQVEHRLDHIAAVMELRPA